jgi:hypothetical protein
VNVEILYKEQSYKIVDACFKVYREKKAAAFSNPFIRSAWKLNFALMGMVIWIYELAMYYNS